MCKFIKLVYLILLVAFASCTSTESKPIENKQQEQLNQLNSLLRDSAFTVAIAFKQDSAYQASQSAAASALPGRDSIIMKSYKEEKIATNLAGFLAVECGIGALMQLDGGTPVEWLQRIVNKGLDSTSILLLNRFANATWKASQPFRGLSRITRDNFIVANFLSEEETKKDFDQVMAAASMLLDTMKKSTNESKEQQIEMISSLMKNKNFVTDMAKHMEASYYEALNKPVPEFLSPADESKMVEKSAFEEQVATKVAGFYALECGVSYMATAQKKLPVDVLKSIENETITRQNKELLERFANATWKAGQAFRSLDRIERSSFTPFSLLSPEEVDKDWVQIKSAASFLLKSFNSPAK
ncbi:MAG: hypothetical protein ABIO82_05120 [Ginsengibacter sp.]